MPLIIVRLAVTAIRGFLSAPGLPTLQKGSEIVCV